MNYLNFLTIPFIIGFIFYSGFIDNFKTFISRFLTNGKIATNNFSLKPFDCPLCLTFWISICFGFYLFGLQLTTILLACVNAFLGNITNLIFIKIEKIINKIINI